MKYYVIEPSGYAHPGVTQPGEVVGRRVLDSGNLLVFRRSPQDEEVLATYVAGSKLVRC